jgi:hypothetical protein
MRKYSISIRKNYFHVKHGFIMQIIKKNSLFEIDYFIHILKYKADKKFDDRSWKLLINLNLNQNYYFSIQITL